MIKSKSFLLIIRFNGELVYGALIKKFNFLLISLFLTFSGCMKEKNPIMIGLSTWPGYGVLFIAEEKGFFDDQNVKVKLKEFMSLSDSKKIFKNGKLDILCCNIEAIIDLFQVTQEPIRAFYVIDLSVRADVILAKKGIQCFTELRGKRIASEYHASDCQILTEALRKNYIEMKDIQWVKANQNLMIQLIEQEKIDAVCSNPPFSEFIKLTYGYEEIFSGEIVSDSVCDVLAANQHYIRCHSQDLKKIVRALSQAALFLKSHPEEGLQIISRRTQIPYPLLRFSLENIRILSQYDQKELFAPHSTLRKAFNGVEYKKNQPFSKNKFNSDSFIEPTIVKDLRNTYDD